MYKHKFEMRYTLDDKQDDWYAVTFETSENFFKVANQATIFYYLDKLFIGFSEIFLEKYCGKDHIQKYIQLYTKRHKPITDA